MTSYAELLQACTEFQENFSVLNGKYSALRNELKLEQETSSKLRQQLEGHARNAEKQEETMRSLKKELEDAYGYKDRYLEANVAAERLKGRLENTRRGVTDMVLEHENQVEQLKAQINDLTHRADVVADGQRMREVRRQVVELEERCAIINGELLEEREKFSQQLMTAHNALREQQSRNLELEQRYRAMEAEITQMRSVVRRSAELQNEAALLKSRHVSEAQRLQTESAELRRDVVLLKKRLTEKTEEHAEEMQAQQREAAAEKLSLQDRITSLTGALNDMAGSRERERELRLSAQRDAQLQVQQAREEALAELTTVQSALSAVKEENQRAQWRLSKLEQELEESHGICLQAEEKEQALLLQQQYLQQQVEAAVQQEAWVSSEKKHLGDKLLAAEKQIDDLTQALGNHQQNTVEVERLKMQIRFRDEELAEAHRLVASADSRMRDVEEAAAKQLRAMRHELRSYRKRMKLESAKADSLRKKLVGALMEKETEIYRCARMYPGGEPVSAIHRDAGYRTMDVTPGTDVISLLKVQNEQAERLHSRLVELSR